MDIDFGKLMDAEKNMRTEDNGNNVSKYPVIYPFKNGSIIIRLLYNPKAGINQRSVIRHDVNDKEKVVCYHTYNAQGYTECPVCEAIKYATSILGKDNTTIPRRYARKDRGVCYAQLVDFSDGYFGTTDKDPKKGDIIQFIYPKTVRSKIADIILNAGVENASKLVSDYKGMKIKITRSTGTNGFPNYDVTVDAFGGTYQSAESQEAFDELLYSIPNLYDAVVPAEPTEEMLQKTKELAEVIKQEVASNTVVNPNTELKPETKPNNFGNVAETVHADNKPDCFGQFDSNSSKCSSCIYEPDCFISKE